MALIQHFKFLVLSLARKRHKCHIERKGHNCQRLTQDLPRIMPTSMNFER